MSPTITLVTHKTDYTWRTQDINNSCTIPIPQRFYMIIIRARDLMQMHISSERVAIRLKFVSKGSRF